jgi:hypothetical protein
MPDFEDLLPSRAAFVRERGETEAAHGIQWLTIFDERTRFRLYAAFQQGFPSWHYTTNELIKPALATFVSDQSQLRLWHSTAESAFTDVTDPSSDEELLDWLAAIPIVLEKFGEEYNGQWSGEHDNAFRYNVGSAKFTALANDVLLDGRIAFTFINNRLRPRTDEPLFLSVIEPMEALLSANPKFADAESAYQQAQGSIAAGQYGAAITSAGSALQATLEALGATGANLGAIYSDAKRRGFLLGHDSKLLDSYKLIADWITADRSNRGTAHGAASAERADADMAVHIIAALVIRLIKHAEQQNNDGADSADEEPEVFNGF